MRICYLLSTTEPSPVISFEITSPILILNVINSMWSYHNTVILPILHHSVRAGYRYIEIWNDYIVVWQLHTQKVKQTLFTNIYWTIVM